MDARYPYLPRVECRKRETIRHDTDYLNNIVDLFNIIPEQSFLSIYNSMQRASRVASRGVAEASELRGMVLSVFHN